MKEWSTALRTAAPLSRAAKLDTLMHLASRQPIYCDCGGNCDKIVGWTEPLISKDEFMALLLGTERQMTDNEQDRVSSGAVEK